MMTLELLLAQRWAEMRAELHRLEQRAKAGDIEAEIAYDAFCEEIEQQRPALELELIEGEASLAALRNWLEDTAGWGRRYANGEAVSRHDDNEKWRTETAAV